MTAPSGISAQWMISEEASYGTFLAPSRALDLVNESVKLKIERIESQGLRAGRRMVLSPQWAAGKRSAGGAVKTELATVNQGLLWKHLMGAVSTATGRSVADGVTNSTTTVTSATANFVATDVGRPIGGSADIPAGTTIAAVNSATNITLSQAATGSHASQSLIINGGTGTYTHVATPGDLTGKSLMHQFGRPDVTGVVRPFSYTGCKAADWTLSCKAGSIAELAITLAAQNETTAQALGTPTYPALMVPMTFVGGSLSIAGSTVPVKDASLKGNNKLDTARFFLAATGLASEPLENGWREYTGSLTADFSSLSLYNYYLNASEVALSLTFTGGTIAGSTLPYSTTITANVRVDGDTPDIPGPGMLSQPVTFKAVAPGATDGTGISVAYTTSDATP